MKPTTEEKQWLQEYLYQALSYRETYAEVYDHILLALEDRPAREFFASTVNDIIEEDFGGSINMLNMETECKVTTNSEVKSQYWHIVGGWFTTPLIAYTVVIFALLFFALSLNNFKIKMAIGIASFLVGVLLPIILISVRSFKIGRTYGDTKECIRDRAFRWLIYGFFLVSMFVLGPVSNFLKVIMMHAFHYHSDKEFGVSISGHILTATNLMIVIIHFLSLVKLYRDEFKTGMITN
jgi:hypothetical protein